MVLSSIPNHATTVVGVNRVIRKLRVRKNKFNVGAVGSAAPHAVMKRRAGKLAVRRRAVVNHDAATRAKQRARQCEIAVGTLKSMKRIDKNAFVTGIRFEKTGHVLILRPEGDLGAVVEIGRTKIDQAVAKRKLSAIDVRIAEAREGCADFQIGSVSALPGQKVHDIVFAHFPAA